MHGTDLDTSIYLEPFIIVLILDNNLIFLEAVPIGNVVLGWEKLPVERQAWTRPQGQAIDAYL